MIENNHFKKTYILEVDIDLDSCHWDAEWGIENLEMDQLFILSEQIREDLENEIKRTKKERD